MRFRFLYGGAEEHEEPYDVGDAWTDAETFGGDICSRKLLQRPVYGVSNEMAERESLKRTKLDGGMQL
ncbi:hypothetical protein N7499_004895 [Penicillium canescens]|uniref:Uncharacterized protein n=1 Tax=Penicillium canescens TaxID=5083 RepID=A0AAD6I1T2_PENCN|nr:uncharacterized protein N7446_004607 [Penicillium canescens]KAJ6009707.1 hypothetical protein N7522_004723 [Penicillium canescens]KAJ6026793.1 hypothetical protein N7460_011610 [Penicillium canescens]KAJ6040078.1 hypothetical protein N7444_008983 [Penicillium canescens]KAJ6067570.1 hypothetical protein N7446_004607 [Penicillium canescens]KAJ6085266.1 hypothetical protein N7499_004895 [Penicillium canescens]